jgi:signal transduction histidine kinase
VSQASRRLRALAALSGSPDRRDGPGRRGRPRRAAGAVRARRDQRRGRHARAVPAVRVTHVGAHAPTEAATLHVVHAIGLPAEVHAALERLPLDAPVPFADVARDGHALYLPDEAALRCYPDWGARMTAAGAQAVAVVPVWANGELRGVLGLAWAAPRAFDEDERAFVDTLGVMVAQALMRAHLRAAELAARTKAEHANATKAAFLATLSHELRTPMNAVLGYTALIAQGVDGPVSPQQRAHLGRVTASGSTCSRSSRTCSATRASRPARRSCARGRDRRGVVERSLALVRPMADAKALRLVVDCARPDLVLHTDPRRLSQVLVNLLANAVKFTAAGDVRLVVRFADERVELHVCFEVSDAGRGIAPADHERVFEPFWRRDPGEPQRDGSTGLGLSVARQLARLLGGDLVLARSAVGGGSTFVVTLPVRHAPGAPGAPAPAPR